MGILDRFKKADLDLDLEEDELLKEALGYSVKKSKKKSKKTTRKTRKSSKKKNKTHKKTITSKSSDRSEHATRRKVIELERDVRSLKKELDKAGKAYRKLKENQLHDVRHMRDEFRALESAVNPKTIHKMIADLSLASKKIRTMEREDNSTLTTLHRIDKKLNTIEKRAVDVESNYIHAKDSADRLQKKTNELKHTASVFMGQMDHFHSKTNAEFSKLVDMERDLYELKQRLAQVEDVKLGSGAMENAIHQNARTLSELARKLEFLERTAKRTIVLD